MVSFTGKEVKHLVFATLALAFVFGFDDGRPSFELVFWLANYVRLCFVAAAVLLVYTLAQKLVADRYSCFSEFRLWTVRRYGFRPQNKFKHPMPLGVIIGFLVAFLSSGKLFFPALASFELTEERHRRIGRRYINVTGVEIAKIALAGVFAALLLAFIFSVFNFREVVFVASLFAVFQMLPIPGLDGVKVFFGSLAYFATSAAFVLVSAILLNFVSGLTAFFIAFIAAGVFGIMFYYYRVYSS